MPKGRRADDGAQRVLSRMRAALRLLSPDDITPMGKRILENILDDEEEHRGSSDVCKHCSETIYQTDMGRWRHTNGMYTCIIQTPRPRPKAEPVVPT